MMASTTTGRRMALPASAAALLRIGMLSACATTEKPAETPPPGSPTAPAPVSPTEKAVTPETRGNGAQNSFAPTVKAPPAPTALPGTVMTGG